MPSALTKATASKVADPPEYIISFTRLTDDDGLVLTKGIRPVPDAVWNELSEAIGQIVLGLRTIASSEAATELDIKKITFGQIADMVPLLVRLILPSSTRVIAASLRVDEAWVQDNVFLRERRAILEKIFEAEGLADLLGEMLGLAKQVVPQIPEAATQPLTELQDTSPSQDISGTLFPRSAKTSRTSKSSPPSTTSSSQS